MIENEQLIQNRPYYMAYCNIDPLALIEEGKGSNSLYMILKIINKKNG
jgi:hypothetical protein